MLGNNALSELPFSTQPVTAGPSKTATIAFTLDSISTNINATIGGGAALTATMAVTLDSISTSIAATTGHTATLAATLSDITVAANATTGHTATMAFSLNSISTAINVSVVPAGAITATMAVTLDGIGVSINANLSQIVVIDTHDGGDRLKKRFNKEVEDKKRRKDQLVDIYEQLVEGRPSIAQELIAPYIEKSADIDGFEPIPSNAIDFDRLLQDIGRIEAIYSEYQEMDDEDVLLLL